MHPGRSSRHAAETSGQPCRHLEQRELPRGAGRGRQRVTCKLAVQKKGTRPGVLPCACGGAEGCPSAVPADALPVQHARSQEPCWLRWGGPARQSGEDGRVSAPACGAVRGEWTPALGPVASIPVGTAARRGGHQWCLPPVATAAHLAGACRPGRSVRVMGLLIYQLLLGAGRKDNPH